MPKPDLWDFNSNKVVAYHNQYLGCNPAKGSCNPAKGLLFSSRRMRSWSLLLSAGGRTLSPTLTPTTCAHGASCMPGTCTVNMCVQALHSAVVARALVAAHTAGALVAGSAASRSNESDLPHARTMQDKHTWPQAAFFLFRIARG